MNNNNPPLTFKRFQAIVSRLELPKKPLPTITPEQMANCSMQVSENHDRHYGVPSLEELGKASFTHASCFNTNNVCSLFIVHSMMEILKPLATKDLLIDYFSNYSQPPECMSSYLA